MYIALGPEGPHQSIHGGRTDWVVDLIERSLTTLDSVYKWPELEGTKVELNDIMGFTDEDHPGVKEDALLRLPPNLALE